MRCIILFTATLFFIACSGKKKSGKEIAQEICDCSSKANALPVSDANRKTEQDKCLQMQQEGWAKVKEMKMEEVTAYNDVLSACAKEQIRKSFGK